MAEAAAGEVVVLDFDDDFGGQGLPLGAAPGRPAARAAGRLAVEAGRLDERLEQRREFFPLRGFEGRAEADVVEQAVIVVEPEFSVVL